MFSNPIHAATGSAVTSPDIWASVSLLDRIVIQGTIAHTKKTAFLDHLDQTWAVDKRLCSADNANQVPATGKPNGLL
ncbi:hypothetical protein HYQ46_009191 [Verticillium longisporum]|nr:hypothetical protein HYQ46_009191 [Verticillium longisporum]